MRCPKCGELDDKVIDSRSSGDGAQIRRRRECLDCGTRFTTYEAVFHEAMRVKKRSGDYQEFDRRKLRNGIERPLRRPEVCCRRMPERRGVLRNTQPNRRELIKRVSKRGE